MVRVRAGSGLGLGLWLGIVLGLRIGQGWVSYRVLVKAGVCFRVRAGVRVRIRAKGQGYSILLCTPFFRIARYP